MSSVNGHGHYWEKGLEDMELRKKYRSSFGNWLYDQIIFLNETTELEFGLQREVLDIFRYGRHVHIESSKFINMLKVLASKAKADSTFNVLCRYVESVKYIPSLSSTDKTELVSIVCDNMLPSAYETETRQQKFLWGKNGLRYLYLKNILELLQRLLSVDGFGAAASNCERCIPLYECLMQEIFRLNLKFHKGLFPKTLGLWFALWAHQEASETSIAHMNSFFTTLPFVLESSFLVDTPIWWVRKRLEEEVSDFIKKFKGKPNLNEKLIETAEKILNHSSMSSNSTDSKSDDYAKFRLQ